MNQDNLTSLEEALGYRFQRSDLLRLALTHSSYAGNSSSTGSSSSDASSTEDNEQLEFLGDSILSFVVTAELVRRFPQFREGALTKLRAHLVSEIHLAEISRRLRIGEHLLLGRGEEKSGGRSKASRLCDGLEAVIAAVYLDGGIDPVRRLVLESILCPEIERLNVQGDSWTITDFKSALQELIQAHSQQSLSYVVVGEEGPDHQKSFTVEVRLLDSRRPGSPVLVRSAVGPTKKKAEQDAARQVFEELRETAVRGSLPDTAPERSEAGNAGAGK